MARRQDLHSIVDRLPEERLGVAQRFLEVLEVRAIDPMILAHQLAPLDDEPSSPEEDASAEEAWQAYLRGEYITAEEAKQLLLDDLDTHE